jgi:hypothetical protein
LIQVCSWCLCPLDPSWPPQICRFHPSVYFHWRSHILSHLIVICTWSRCVFGVLAYLMIDLTSILLY